MCIIERITRSTYLGVRQDLEHGPKHLRPKLHVMRIAKNVEKDVEKFVEELQELGKFMWHLDVVKKQNFIDTSNK